MEIILERDSTDKPLTFNVCLLQLIFHTSVFTYYIFMQRCFQSSNFAEGLHFSAFHYTGSDWTNKAIHTQVSGDNHMLKENKLTSSSKPTPTSSNSRYSFSIHPLVCSW